MLLFIALLVVVTEPAAQSIAAEPAAASTPTPCRACNAASASLCRGASTPPLLELTSRSDWIAAVKRYGETRGDDPSNLRVVYSTAGQAVRSFMACAGTVGMVTLLDAVRAGEAFDVAHARLTRRCPD